VRRKESPVLFPQIPYLQDPPIHVYHSPGRKLQVLPTLRRFVQVHLNKYICHTGIFGLGLVLIKMNSKSLKPFRFLAQYAFRAYLANCFVTVMLVKFMGGSANSLPYGFHIALVWEMTAIFSFTLVYGIEYVLKYLPAVLKENR
jgi:hypothetical protein